MAKKRNSWGIALYFVLLAFLIAVFVLHAFRLTQLETGFFSRYVLALIFVVMILPLVPKIKIFDIVDIKREARMFKTQSRNKRK
jgi:Ca2+/Na+ antiporter